MYKNDELIAQALSAEDRELLARHAEPGYFSQAFGLFRGSLGWVVWLAYLTGIVSFLGFGWSLWQAWTTPELIAVTRWGIVAIVLFQYTAMVKMFLGSHLEANRLLREVKRVELQVAMARAETAQST